MIPILTLFHALAAVVWVGGIFFAFMALRPASMQLEPALRLALWRGVFGRFFPWVWGFVIVLLVSGHALFHQGVGVDSHPVAVMAALGWLMCLLFAYLYFFPYRQLCAALARGEIHAAAAAMGRIRPIIAINLLLGLATSALGVSARFWA